jgi:superfamily II DNA/RNA helicase
MGLVSEELKVDAEDEEEDQTILSKKTFEELGVCPEICEAVKAMGYLFPSKI